MTMKSHAKFEEKLTSGLENHMKNLANFHQNIESLKICTLWGSFIRSRKCMSLKFTGELWVMSYDNAEWCKTWKGIDLSVQNWHEEFNKFWPEDSKISKNCTLMGYLWPKYIMFELRKYRGVMFDGTKHWQKIWRQTDLCFQKWHEEFGKFSPEHLKVSKLSLSWDPFIQNRK